MNQETTGLKMVPPMPDRPRAMPHHHAELAFEPVGEQYAGSQGDRDDVENAHQRERDVELPDRVEEGLGKEQGGDARDAHADQDARVEHLHDLAREQHGHGAGDGHDRRGQCDLRARDVQRLAEDGEIQAWRVDDQAESDQGQYAAADEHQPGAAGRLGLGGHSNLHVRCCFLLRSPCRFHHRIRPTNQR